MKRTISLDKLNDALIESNVENGIIIQHNPRILQNIDNNGVHHISRKMFTAGHRPPKDALISCLSATLPKSNTSVFFPGKRRSKSRLSNIFEFYSITIKPRLNRSNSLSDLATNGSDITLHYTNRTSKLLVEQLDSCFGSVDSSGDTSKAFHKEHKTSKAKCQEIEELSSAHVHWNGDMEKKQTKDVNHDLYPKFPKHCHCTDSMDPNGDSSIENSSSSTCTVEKINNQHRQPVFPFKPTPSGNFKVNSNQIVFQSSTVGVLLADPTQAKVEVKFGSNSADDSDLNGSCELKFKSCDHQSASLGQGRCGRSAKHHQNHACLAALGYGSTEPIDWLRVQLPKKQDLFKEFYRRIHNHINTDTIVRIGNEEFHCHRIILQIYSNFFDGNQSREFELPIDRVTPEAFPTIYEWMIFNGPESNKLLKRENVLQLFCAAQFLSIKDLEEQCWSFIVNENLFTEDTAFILYRQARLKAMAPVMDLMIPRVMRFFLPLVASTDFLELEAEEVLTLLRSNYICVTSEIEVLMAGVRWLYGDWTNRCHLAVDVMRCVRFGLISPWQLVDIKRNPDNAEILQIVNEPEVQHMVDDGLAYVIIKYWYGNNSKSYYHWLDVLVLAEPVERNWIGEETNHVTYKDFIKYLEQFLLPKEQMFQQMEIMQPPRRLADDGPGTMRSLETEKEMRRQKFDFPLPDALKGLSGKDPAFTTMDDILRKKNKMEEEEVSRSPRGDPDERTFLLKNQGRDDAQEIPKQHLAHLPAAKQDLHVIQQQRRRQKSCAVNVCTGQNNFFQKAAGRDSLAVSYLAAATEAFTKSRRASGQIQSEAAFDPLQSSTAATASLQSPKNSLFNQSKESIARANMNKLSTSVLGPPNKNYIAKGSLFNWDRETVLVFGGIDPHTPYGANKNLGKDIYRFDPMTNTWNCVRELPEPRHHHSVAFLRGRVYVVGGADPGEDDIRGKSVVVPTVWSYEPVTRTWHSEGDLVVPRKNFGLVVHRMALYAIGGQDNKGRVLRSVERYDPKTGSWTEVRPMGTARMAVALVKYRDYIWVAGGMTGDKRKPVCKTVECYNSKTDEWTEIYPLRFPRCFATLFAMNDRLYIVGGAGKLSDKDKTASSVGAIDVWNWKDRKWKLETEMAIPRHGHALSYLGTQLLIIGGVTTMYMRALSNVESFCCERSAWIRGVCPLPSPLSGHGAVTLPPASLM